MLLTLLFITSLLTVAADKPTRDQYGTISHTICDGELAELSCPTGKVISIVIGNYGRFSNQVCIDDADNFVPLDNNCQNHKTKAILEKKCNGKPMCELETNTKTFVEDPCPQTTKYLEVKYNCTYPETTTTTTTSTTSTTTTTTETAKTLPGGGVVAVEIAQDDIKKEIDLKKFVCKKQTRRGVEWPATEAGKTAKRTCPEGSNGVQSWECTVRGEWSSRSPNTTTCESQWTTTRLATFTEVINNEDASGIPELLRNLASDTRRPMVAGDVPKVLHLLERIVEVVSEEDWTRGVQTMTVKGIVEVVNYIIRSDDVWKSWSPTKAKQFSARTLVLTEKAMLTSSQQVSSTDSNVIVQPSVNSELSPKIKVSGQPTYYFMFPSAAIWGHDNVDNVNIPREALEKVLKDEAQVYFSSFAGIGEQMQPRDLNVSSKSHTSSDDVVTTRRRRVVTRVVAASIVFEGKAQKIERLEHPVEITFYHHPSSVRHMESPTCVWWNQHELDWSPLGCALRSHNSSLTVCHCDHLTHFAVLMDIRGVEIDEADEQLLTLLTYIGCSVSIVCLILTFLAFVVFSKNGGDRVFIHENLCLTLAAAETVFLLGIWRTENTAECGAIAGALLYLFLSALTWMLLEGYHIYRMLVQVFPGVSKRITFTLIGYGTPALVTVAAYLSDSTGFGTYEHCWLRTDNNFIMFFVAPATVILLANSAMLIKTLCVVYKHSNGGYLPCRHDPETGRNARSWVKGSMALVCLLGVTWTIGLLWIDDGKSILMAYAFTVCNSLQGLFIFLFHVVFSEKMRKDIERWVSRHGCCGSQLSSGQKRATLPRDVLSPGMGSSTGTEFFYPPSEKYQQTQGLDTSSPYRFEGSVRQLPYPMYEPQQHHQHYAQYDYATIAYGEMLPGQSRIAPPAYQRLQQQQQQQQQQQPPRGMTPIHHHQQMVMVDPRYAYHHRPPPEFSPPPPPGDEQRQQLQNQQRSVQYGTSQRRPPSSKMSSDDSAYSDGGSSSMLTTEVTPQGQTVLRIDLGRPSAPNMYCQEL